MDMTFTRLLIQPRGKNVRVYTVCSYEIFASMLIENLNSALWANCMLTVVMEAL